MAIIVLKYDIGVIVIMFMNYNYDFTISLLVYFTIRAKLCFHSTIVIAEAAEVD